ncbi:ModE molybdate transport repressor domain-containing protein [Micrococcales bacterium KH10]|nr:ModE molybdate transport repressor domain-containing protein [Micrococcales bacterium KH10]
MDRTSLAALQVLTAIDEQGSISAAARSLELSQPSASAAVRRLERRIGATLLSRTPRGSALNETGRAVAVWARQVIAASDAFETSIAALREGHAERVQIAASLTIAEYLAPRWLAHLATVRPHADVELIVRNSHDVMDLVTSGQVELGFVEGAKVEGGLRSQVIGRDELVAVVAPGHRWVRRGAVGLKELVAGGLVLREVGSGTREILERVLQESQIELPAHVPHLGSTAAIKAAVRHGGSVAVLSRLTVADELELGSLVPIEVLGADLSRQLRMVWCSDAVLGASASELAGIAARSTGL